MRNNTYNKAKYFGMYLGEKYLEYFPHDKRCKPVEDTLASIHYEYGDNFLLNPRFDEDGVTPHSANIKNCQLILKPIKSLTVNHAEQIFNTVDVEYTIQSIKQGFTDDIVLSEWMKLIKLGYAIPVMGLYDPFDTLGWAVEK